MYTHKFRSFQKITKFKKKKKFPKCNSLFSLFINSAGFLFILNNAGHFGIIMYNGCFTCCRASKIILFITKFQCKAKCQKMSKKLFLKTTLVL